jgi:diguanylate cyclase (GGDEF)-like protein/PAS domain S-box-containing protein
MTTREAPRLPWPLLRPWHAFARAHLHDYPAAATRLWLAITLAGALALMAVLWALSGHPARELWQIAGWTLLALLAAAFPLQIPRSKHSIAAGDTVIFLLLALHGAPAAALAAALECLLASTRNSARLSSRIASPAAAAAGMFVAGGVFAVTQAALEALAMPHAAAHLAALAAAALLYYTFTTMALNQVVLLKRGQRLQLNAWFKNTSWVGALYLVSSMLAGLLSLNAQQFGRAAITMGMLVMGLSLALMRAHFRQQIAEHEAQEARVRLAEQEAQQNQKRFHAAFTHASIGMALVSPQRLVLQANQALCSLLGYSEGQLQGKAVAELLHAGDAALLDRHADAVLERREPPFSIELRCLSAQRRETWVSLHCALFDSDSGADAGLILQLHDITSRKRAEGELHHIAYHDHLTDLANRSCFIERLSNAVERSRTERRYGFAVMFLDLDRFKNVNDALGHPAGDELLKEAAQRISDCVRPDDLVARLGGDEFAILVEQPPGQATVLQLGQRVLQALDQPVRVNGTELRPSASIGITFSDMGYREPDEVLRDADLAMYKAKAEGKGRLALFDASLHEQLGSRLQLEADLRRAIGEGQLSLAYQPLYTLQPYALCGFEALARWEHPTRGAVSPAVFIALAEETGCIEALTAWAVDEAVRQHAAWRSELPALGELAMHVNVSGKDLARPAFLPHVRAALDRHDLPARLLTLEITESTLMEQRERALGTLDALSRLGVKLGIDDFGTGYSSLAYLSTLPFDCLKIDRSFVTGMAQGAKNTEIVRTILSLGRTLQKDIVAEGIETREQLLRLTELGATIGQGYLLSRPLPAHDAGALLRRSVALVA